MAHPTAHQASSRTRCASIPTIRRGAAAFRQTLDVLTAISEATVLGDDPEAHDGGDHRDYVAMVAVLSQALIDFGQRDAAYRQGFARAMVSALASEIDDNATPSRRADPLEMTARSFAHSQGALQ